MTYLNLHICIRINSQKQIWKAFSTTDSCHLVNLSMCYGHYLVSTSWCTLCSVYLCMKHALTLQRWEMGRDLYVQRSCHIITEKLSYYSNWNPCIFLFFVQKDFQRRVRSRTYRALFLGPCPSRFKAFDFAFAVMFAKRCRKCRARTLFIEAINPRDSPCSDYGVTPSCKMRLPAARMTPPALISETLRLRRRLKVLRSGRNGPCPLDHVIYNMARGVLYNIL